MPPVAGPDDATAPAPAERSSPGWKAWVAAGAVAAVVAVGAGFVLGNQSDDGAGAPAAASTDASGNTASVQRGSFPGGMGTAGTVSAVDGSTLTVTGQDDAETTVQTTDETVVTRSAEGDLSDLAVGDQILVMGETSGDAVAAQRIVDSGDEEATVGFGPAGGPPSGTPPTGTVTEGELPDGQAPPTGGADQPGAPTSGEITKIDGDTITVKTDDGTVTVTTSDDTEVSTTETIEVSDIAEGDTVVVMGETADDVVTAKSIRVGDLGAGGFRPEGAPPDGATPPAGAAPSTGSDGSGTVTGT
jgi:hypothetical protein